MSKPTFIACPVHKTATANCMGMGACLASLLDVPLWMVPAFDSMFGATHWHDRIGEWLKRMHKREFVSWSGHRVKELPALYIGAGLSLGPAPAPTYRACLYKAGALVHDPHAYPAPGLVSVMCTYHLRLLGA